MTTTFMCVCVCCMLYVLYIGCFEFQLAIYRACRDFIILTAPLKSSNICSYEFCMYFAHRCPESLIYTCMHTCMYMCFTLVQLAIWLHQFLVSVSVSGQYQHFLVVSELVRCVTQVPIPLLYEVIT